MKLGKIIKRLWHFAIDNYFISIFFACIAFVVLVSAYKLFFAKPTYVYVKVKMGQGLWWASTAKTPIWFVKNIKKGDIETELTGNPSAKILSVRYYPWYTSNQYDVYLTLKLKVTGNKKTGKYNFNRSTIGVGAPIDLEFPSTQFSGTIIVLSENPLKEDYVITAVTLTKKNAFPWEYDAIQVGDSLFDGVDTVFTVKGKQALDTDTLAGDTYGNYPAGSADLKKYIIVKAKIKVKKIDNQLVFGEEQVISLGKTINVATENFQFQDYVVSKVE